MMRLPNPMPRMNLLPFMMLSCLLLVTVAPDSTAQLVNIPLTPDLANSSASGFGGNMANTTSDPFPYNPDAPTASLPGTDWNPATHFHGNGGNPTLYWSLDEILWTDGADLQFDFYGRTNCCPDRDNNYDIALLTGGPTGTVVHQVTGNNAPDAGNPANYLRTNLGAGLSPGQSFDTVRITGNNGNFTVAEIRMAANLTPTSIASFSATPATVPSNAPVIFTWEFNAAATAATIVPSSGDLASLIGNVLPQTNAGAGSTVLDPGPVETTTYQLTVTVDGEDSTALLTISVDNNPIISSFEADQTTITAGTDITLTWDVTNSNDLKINGSPLDPAVNSVVLSPLVSTIYTLEATNANGMASSSISISVQDIPDPDAQLETIPLTPDLVASSPSGFGGNLTNTTSDLFAYDPNDPFGTLPTTDWNPATHYHGPGSNPTLYWSFEELTWGSGSDLRFDFYGRTGCCPERDNNFDIALLTGGPNGTVVAEVLGNNAPDNDSNRLRINLGAVLAPGDRFDTLRITGNDGNFTIAEIRLAGLLRSESLVRITDVRFNGSTTELAISWESDPGYLYNIRGASEPADAGEPATWDLILENIEATPPENTSAIPIDPGADPFSLFVVERFPKPPVTILEENFDAGDPGWTAGFAAADLSKNTVWEMGDPALGGAPLTGPPTAFSGANCYGTNLIANYGIESEIWLRSTPFFLPSAPYADLTFRQWVDIDPFETGSPLDHGQVRVLAAADLSEIGAIDMNISGLDPVEWTEFSGEFPDSALGQEVILEFRFLSDNDGIFDQSGWYIDNVAVSAPAP